jgi:L-fuculose-phosphate aldolase
MIAIGASLAKAMWLAVEVENLARQYHGCLAIGKPPRIPRKEMKKVIGMIASYGRADG